MKSVSLYSSLCKIDVSIRKLGNLRKMNISMRSSLWKIDAEIRRLGNLGNTNLSKRSSPRHPHSVNECVEIFLFRKFSIFETLPEILSSRHRMARLKLAEKATLLLGNL